MGWLPNPASLSTLWTTAAPKLTLLLLLLLPLLTTHHMLLAGQCTRRQQRRKHSGAKRQRPSQLFSDAVDKAVSRGAAARRAALRVMLHVW